MIIFLFSIIFALLILSLERLIGISLDYHPDSLTYLEFSDETLVNSFVENPLNFMGSFFYVLVGFLNKNTFIIITINILVFAITNLILYLSVKNILNKKNNFYLILSLLLIFDPYRAHLSIHILKDTLIIFSVISTLFFINNKFFFILSVFLAIFGMFLRSGFHGYLLIIVSFLKKKNFYILIILFFIIIPFVPFEFHKLDNFSEKVSLAFREFDKIPNFVNLNYPFGEILRGLTWPIIRVFNFAFLFHPIYIIFIIQSLAFTFLFFYNKNYLNLNILLFYFTLAVIASSAPGYNTYLRYTQPVVTALYLWVISTPSKKFNFYKKKA